ncbi:MAG: disulfide bond formation protein B [Alphaproteobacteria bacterium]
MLAPSRDHAVGAPFWRANPAVAAALVVAIVGAAAIGGAWFFEFVLHYQPCPLCLEQRVPYYIGIPLALGVAIAAWRGAPRALVVGGLIALAALMLWDLYIAVFHAGVEWKLWAGPTECSGAATLGPAGGLLNRLQDIIVVRCDEAAWRFLGISLAGYNALIAAALAVVALLGAWKSYGSSSVSQ